MMSLQTLSICYFVFFNLSNSVNLISRQSAWDLKMVSCLPSSLPEAITPAAPSKTKLGLLASGCLKIFGFLCLIHLLNFILVFIFLESQCGEQCNLFTAHSSTSIAACCSFAVLTWVHSAVFLVLHLYLLKDFTSCPDRFCYFELILCDIQKISDFQQGKLHNFARKCSA